MAITQRGKGWQVYIKKGDVRFRKTYYTKEEATVQEAMVRQAISLGQPIPQASQVTMDNDSYTLQRALDRCYEVHWVGTRSENNCIMNMKYLMNWFGKQRCVSKIDTDLIDDFIQHEKDKNSSNGTINRKLATLSKSLRHAFDTGKLDRMPKINRQKEAGSRVRWVTPDEEAAIISLLTQWGQVDLLDAFIVSVDTGMRRGELLRLKASDVVKQGVYLHKTKNDLPRVVPLTRRARAIIERRKKGTLGKLFTLTTGEIRRGWDKVRNHLDLTDVCWHVLRHTTCSRLIQGGMPLPHVKDWMGHKTIMTTMRYAHLAPKHLDQGVSLLEGNCGPTGGLSVA